MNHFETFSAYVGVAGGIVGLYAVLFVWRRLTAFWNVAFIGIVLLVLGTPLVRIHYIGTGGAQLLYNRLAWFLPICAAVLVAVHGAAVIERQSLRLFSLGTVGVVAVSVCSLVWAYLPVEAGNRGSQAVVTAAAVHFAIFFLCFLGALTAAGRWGEGHAVVRVLLLAPLLLDVLLVARLEADNSNAFLSPPPFSSRPRKRCAWSACSPARVASGSIVSSACRPTRASPATTGARSTTGSSISACTAAQGMTTRRRLASRVCIRIRTRSTGSRSALLLRVRHGRLNWPPTRSW